MKTFHACIEVLPGMAYDATFRCIVRLKDPYANSLDPDIASEPVDVPRNVGERTQFAEVFNVGKVMADRMAADRAGRLKRFWLEMP